ncbi:MAG TPA: FAD-binding domain [Gemmatimonadales bacterium]|jgi:2-polyprenyl-6-methoxyphenol hydroxylase-like FAD-dependent oxidoreductase
MKVAINGIGVAGPTLAYWLQQYGHEPVLFEKAPALRTGGYLIDFWGLGYEIAERMGVIGDLLERSYRMKRMRMVDADGEKFAGIDVEPLRAQANGRFISLARGDLVSALFGACGGVSAHFGVWIAGLEPEQRGVRVVLSNGRREMFDVVVGADGVHSLVRELAFGQQTLFETLLGCHVAAFRLPGYPARNELTYVSHTATKRHVARVALRDNETLVLLVCRSELLAEEATKEEATTEQQKAALRRAFGGMGWELPEILDRMDRIDELYFDRASQVHLPCWSSDRVALIGDAAACPSLLAGEGTGLAMIEAYVLAGELSEAKGDYQRAFEAYESRLRQFVIAKQKAAARLRSFFAPRTALSLWVRNLAARAMSVPFLAKRLAGGAMRDDLELPQYEVSPTAKSRPSADSDTIERSRWLS